MKSQTLFILSIFIIWLCNSCNESQRDRAASISFAIEGYGNDTIQLWQNDFLKHSEVNSKILILDKDGSGSITLTYPDKSFGSIRIEDFIFPFISIDGSELAIIGNSSDLPNTLKFSGTGSLPNEYLQAKKAIINKYNNLDGKYFFQLDSMQFWDRILAFSSEVDSLNNWLARQKIDTSLEALLRLESQNTAKTYILNYALVKGYKTQAYSANLTYDQSLFKSLSTSYAAVLMFNYNFELELKYCHQYRFLLS